MSLPVDDPVKLVVQLAVPILTVASVQLDGLISPAPVVTKLAWPEGVTGLPAVELSCTVTVHVDTWFTTTGLVQLKLVAVVRLLMMILLPAAVWLGAWSESVEV